MNDFRLRNQKSDIFGRSMILNLAAILLNLAGVYCIVLGFHERTLEWAAMWKIIGITLVAVTLFAMIMLKGFFLFAYVSRAFVGGLFIVSGVIKANDPWGFAIKLGEYFEKDALSADYPFFLIFEDYTMPLAIIICIAEIVLGVAVIVGGKIKLASWLLVFMMAFFTWLTAYTTSCNESQLAAAEAGQEFNYQCVTDCGCFGDALRGSVGRSLTPHESFWKDLVLFYFVLIIFFNQWKTQMNTVRENWVMVPGSMAVLGFFSWVFGWSFPLFFGIFVLLGSFVIGNLNIGKIGKPWKMAMFTALISFLLSLYTSLYLPLKDYRPYAVGNNIREQMNNGVAQVSEFALFYEELASGKTVEFKLDEWEIYGDTTKYKYKDRQEKIIVEGVPSSIMDFRATIGFDELSEEERKIPFVDSVVIADRSLYVEDMMTAESEWGTDTITVAEYDPEFYPDSLYRLGPKFTRLIDPTKPFVIDLTNYLLDAEFIFLMTIMDIAEVNPGHMDDFIAVYDQATEKGIPFVVLTPASSEEVAKFKSQYSFHPMFLAFDATEIKIIIRSNPGLVLLKRATVLDMWPSRSVADFEDIYEDYFSK